MRKETTILSYSYLNGIYLTLLARMAYLLVRTHFNLVAKLF